MPPPRVRGRPRPRRWFRWCLALPFVLVVAWFLWVIWAMQSGGHAAFGGDRQQPLPPSSLHYDGGTAFLAGGVLGARRPRAAGLPFLSNGGLAGGGGGGFVGDVAASASQLKAKLEERFLLEFEDRVHALRVRYKWEKQTQHARTPAALPPRVANDTAVVLVASHQGLVLRAVAAAITTRVAPFVWARLRTYLGGLEQHGWSVARSFDRMYQQSPPFVPPRLDANSRAVIAVVSSLIRDDNRTLGSPDVMLLLEMLPTDGHDLPLNTMSERFRVPVPIIAGKPVSLLPLNGEDKDKDKAAVAAAAVAAAAVVVVPKPREREEEEEEEGPSVPSVGGASGALSTRRYHSPVSTIRGRTIPALDVLPIGSYGGSCSGCSINHAQAQDPSSSPASKKRTTTLRCSSCQTGAGAVAAAELPLGEINSGCAVDEWIGNDRGHLRCERRPSSGAASMAALRASGHGYAADALEKLARRTVAATSSARNAASAAGSPGAGQKQQQQQQQHPKQPPQPLHQIQTDKPTQQLHHLLRRPPLPALPSASLLQPPPPPPPPHEQYPWRARFATSLGLCADMAVQAPGASVRPKYKSYATRYCQDSGRPGGKRALWKHYLKDDFATVVEALALPLHLDKAGSLFESGMGCGAIFDTLLKRYPHLAPGGVDVSPEALAFATEAFARDKRSNGSAFRNEDMRRTSFPDNSFDRAVSFAVLQEVGHAIMAGTDCSPTFPWARRCAAHPGVAKWWPEYGSSCGHWDGDAQQAWCFCPGCSRTFMGGTWDACSSNGSAVSCAGSAYGTAAWGVRREHAERHMCCAVRELVRLVRPGGMVGLWGAMDEECRFQPGRPPSRSSWMSVHGVYLDDGFWKACLPNVTSMTRIPYRMEKYCEAQYSVIIVK